MFPPKHFDEDHTHNVSPEILSRIWKENQIPRSTWYPRSTFHCEGLVKSPDQRKLYMAKRVTEFEPDDFTLPRDYIEELISAASQPADHFCRLDELYCRLVHCAFVTPEDTCSENGHVISAAADLLSRLPEDPIAFFLDIHADLRLASLPAGYFDFYPTVGLNPEDERRKWRNLTVSSTFSTNILRLALLLSQGILHTPFLRNLRRLGDTTASLLEEAVEIGLEAIDSVRKNACFVTQAFLWSSWQRFAMLYFWHALRTQLKSGYDYGLNEYMALQGMPISRAVYDKNCATQPTSDPPAYMCNWAFRLVSTERSSINLDFRRFHARFNTCFGGRPARCIGNQPCNGKSPESCERFVGTRVEDQSMHDKDCLEPLICRKLYWDESSYRAVQTTRAVCIKTTSDRLLRYCMASERTLAISHVWAHGQGGRPEETSGMNICLHHRYASIAQNAGCDSYWMDTSCIPEDDELRSQAIRGINGVFLNSKITLVCDKDLMELDLSEIATTCPGYGKPSTSAILNSERLLSTLLVCDWNVRAWTLLESMKGRSSIHILCQDNVIVSLKELIQIVCDHGAIDIAILYVTAQHLLPARPADKAAGDRSRIGRGLINLEEAASLLSHRHASRDGDDVIIWSLLFNEQAFKTAETLWRADSSGHTDNINSGFLLSSAPRLKDIKGLSWAPSRPAIRLTPEEEAKGYRAHMAVASYNTSLCHMTPEGLQGAWYIHIFSPSLVIKSGQLSDIAEVYLNGCHFGALLRPITMNTMQETVPTQFQGNASGPLLAVCGRVCAESPWRWKGVFEWKADEDMPKFTSEMLTIA